MLKERKRLRFDSPSQLKAWLRDTTAGQAILDELRSPTKEWLWTTPQGEEAQAEVLSRYEQRERVVVEIWPDGLVKLYGSKKVSAVVLERPIVCSVEGEALLDEFMELKLPLGYRAVYGADGVRAAGRPSKEEIRDMAYREKWRDTFEYLEALTKGDT